MAEVEKDPKKDAFFEKTLALHKKLVEIGLKNENMAGTGKIDLHCINNMGEVRFAVNAMIDGSVSIISFHPFIKNPRKRSHGICIFHPEDARKIGEALIAFSEHLPEITKLSEEIRGDATQKPNAAQHCNQNG